MCKEDKIQIQISIFSRHDVPVRLCVSFISWCSSEIEMMLLEQIVVTKPNFIKNLLLYKVGVLKVVLFKFIVE